MEESKTQTVQKNLIKVFLSTLIVVLAYYGYFETMNILGMPEGEVSPGVMFAIGLVSVLALIAVGSIKGGIKNDETQRVLMVITLVILISLAGFRGHFNRIITMILEILP